MQETLLFVKKTALRILVQRRIAVATMMIVAPLGWFVLTLVPDSYQSRAEVYFDGKSMLSRSLQGLAIEAEATEGEFINYARTVLMSEPTLARVALETDFQAHRPVGTAQAVLLAELASEINLVMSRPNGSLSGDHLVRIEFNAHDPELAFSVVNSLVNELLETILGSGQEDVENTENFLVQKVDEYKTLLEDSEYKLQEFKRKYVGLLPEDGVSYFTELQSTRTMIDDNLLSREQLTRQRDELRKQMLDLSNVNQSDSSIQTPFDERISDLEAKLTDLLLRFTPAHPEVIAVTSAIDALKQANSQERGESDRLNALSLSGNRVLEDLRIQISTIDAELASVNALLQEYEKRLSRLNEAVNTIPKVEAEYIQLTRDYDGNKARYDDLLSRLESTRLSKEKGNSQGNSSFRIVNPPKVPVDPVTPNRLLAAAGILLVSIGIGLGAGFVASEVRRVFLDYEDLTSFKNLTVLGAVSSYNNTALIPIHSIVMYAVLLGSLFAMFVAYLYFFVF